MSKNKNNRRNDYFSQQKVFGDWNNLLEPPIRFAELISNVIVTPNAPDGFVKGLEEYHLAARVTAKKL